MDLFKPPLNVTFVNNKILGGTIVFNTDLVESLFISV